MLPSIASSHFCGTSDSEDCNFLCLPTYRDRLLSGVQGVLSFLQNLRYISLFLWADADGGLSAVATVFATLLACLFCSNLAYGGVALLEPLAVVVGVVSVRCRAGADIDLGGVLWLSGMRPNACHQERSKGSHTHLCARLPL